MPLWEGCVFVGVIIAGSALAYVRVVAVAESHHDLQHAEVISQLIDDRSAEILAKCEQGIVERLSSK
jgi:predicted alpha/beta-hydrolase family hydrolase